MNNEWDTIVVGGGASGLGTALESASRGYRTLLIERGDFASYTSSKSTKLIHGGVRYLKQGNLRLVREALLERSFLLEKIPEIVKERSIILPTSSFIEKNYYKLGIFTYDQLAGSNNIRRSKWLSKEQLIKSIPYLKRTFNGGILFYDAQFDDSRLAIQLARSIYDYSGTAVNYTEVIRIDSKRKQIACIDHKKGNEITLKYKHLINATGPFLDRLCNLENSKNTKKTIRFSRGSHLLINSNRFKQKDGLILPRTKDGRVLFILPWKGIILAGTTDVEMKHLGSEPKVSNEEVEFILSGIRSIYDVNIEQKDIISTFSGIRPLSNQNSTKNTSKISREHRMFFSESGMLSISGGKWTTFRKIGEDTINFLEKLNHLKPTISLGHEIQINNHLKLWHQAEALYGKEPINQELIIRGTNLARSLKKEEYAFNAEDILQRRTRVGLLAPKTAKKWKPILDQALDIL